MERQITLKEEDLFEIADGIFSTSDDMVCVAFKQEDRWIKRILLREVLKCYGEQYHIVSEEDDSSDGLKYVIVTEITNLPMSIAERFMGDMDLCTIVFNQS